MSNTWFAFKKFTIYQDQCAMKVTTDACLLGSYAHATDPERILDIGTGTGVLSIMVAQRFSRAVIDAVEIDEDACRQARDNILNSPWSDRIHLHQARVQDFVRENLPYDLILCNPPYFNDHLKSGKPRKDLARHSTGLSIEELAHMAALVLKGRGRLYLILPAEPFEMICRELAPAGLSLVDHLVIRETKERGKLRHIGGFSREDIPKKDSSLFIREASGDYSEAFRSLLKDYYPAF